MTLYVLDSTKDAIFAYDLESGELAAEYALDSLNGNARGIWSDGVTLWVSDHGAKRLFAYRLPVPPDAAEAHQDGQALERVLNEEFTRLSRASNNSPHGIWSDREVMYVADESDDRVYTYNMPDAIDGRLASLSLSGIDIGEFDPGRTEYEGTVADAITETTVAAEAVQLRTTVTMDPPDTDADTTGHQVDLGGVREITVTSADGTRTKTYRVRLGETEQEAVPEPWPHCMRGDIAVGFSLVVYEGGSVEESATCAESRDVAAFYALHGGVYLPYIPGAPEFVNQPFAELFAGGVPPFTPLVAGSNGPPSSEPGGHPGSVLARVPTRRGG